MPWLVAPGIRPSVPMFTYVILKAEPSVALMVHTGRIL
jgi:hypothetical protein